MNWQPLSDVWPVLVAMGYLALLAYLRALAIYRQRQIETHDVARQAVALRRDYEAKVRAKREVPAEA
jgi:hypothetical protein